MLGLKALKTAESLFFRAFLTHKNDWYHRLKNFTKKYLFLLENMVNMYYTESGVKYKADLFASCCFFFKVQRMKKGQNE